MMWKEKKNIRIILIFVLIVTKSSLSIFADSVEGDVSQNSTYENKTNNFYVEKNKINVGYQQTNESEKKANVYETSSSGLTYYLNGDVKDSNGTIYHTDGSTTLPDGAKKDADGIVHYADGSIMLPDGTKYLINGAMVSPGGIHVNPQGEIITPENDNKETPGSWKYDPTTNKWKFELVNEDGTKKIYKDQWINTKNAQGELSWYIVDKDGNMITGWLKSGGEYYYMSMKPDSRGELTRGKATINGNNYEFDKDTGILKTGEVHATHISVVGEENHISGVDGEWRVYDSGEKYYVTFVKMNDGKNLEVPPSEWYMIDGKYYYFDKYGIPKTGLTIIDEKYYYFNDDGTMQEGGEVVIGEKTYVFDKATGACITIRLN